MAPTTLSLASFLADPRTTHVDVFWMPADAPGVRGAFGQHCDLSWPSQTPWAQARFKLNEQRLAEFQHGDLTYVYDLANDSQRAFRRLLRQHAMVPGTRLGGSLRPPCCVLAWEEDAQPPHRFPCTTDIAHRDTYRRWTARVSNRLAYHIDEVSGEAAAAAPRYVHWIRYTHAANVDIGHMQKEWAALIERFVV